MSTRDDVIFTEMTRGCYDLAIAGRVVSFDVDPDDFDEALRRSRHGISYPYTVRPLSAPESVGTYTQRGRR